MAVTPEEYTEAQNSFGVLVLTLFGVILGCQWFAVLFPIAILISSRRFINFLIAIPIGFLIHGALVLLTTLIFGRNGGLPGSRSSYFDIGFQIAGVIGIGLLIWLGLWVVWKAILFVIRFFASIS